MNHSLKVGFSFGLTSGIITTLGLMVGLNSSTHSASVVISGILIIALTDALSDAAGIHISEESEGRHSHKEIWQSTFATFFSKLFFALTFIIPALLFPLNTAVVISVIWGLSLIIIFSCYLSKKNKKKQKGLQPWKVVLEHLLLAISVIIATHYIGELISQIFS